MAQYDIILAQNVHATGVEFTEQAVNLTENQLVIGNANKLPSSFANGTSKYYLRTNAGATAPEWKLMAGTPETSFTLNEDGSTNKLKLQAGGTGNFTLTVQTPTLTAARTQTFQDKDGTIALTSDITDAIGANDAMIYKGVIDASTNPNYPAADAGWTYKISVAGKIGGASGVNVEVGDMIICTADGTASGTHATVGTSWNIIQMNIDGYVLGPASSTNNNIAVFDGVSGKLIKDGGVATTAFALSSHVHGNITNTGYIGTTANIPIITGTGGILQAGSFGSAANTFCQGNDPRLSDARTPLSHTHGNITNAGAIGTTANLPIITTTSGVLTVGSFGNSVNTFCQGNDSRLSDARSLAWYTPVPATKTSVGTTGAIAKDNNYLYICLVGGAEGSAAWSRIPIAKNW